MEMLDLGYPERVYVFAYHKKARQHILLKKNKKSRYGTYFFFMLCLQHILLVKNLLFLKKKKVAFTHIIKFIVYKNTKNVSAHIIIVLYLIIFNLIQIVMPYWLFYNWNQNQL